MGKMNDENSEIIDKIRRHFDGLPYFNAPLDYSPKQDTERLYFHNLLTPYYLRNQRVIRSEGKAILDAGCGSGYKSLILAEANPGAKIVGIDLSEESVKLARQRLLYHGFEDAEFYALAIEELPDLGLEFDYINCDETLYLLPNIVAGLQAMKSVLKPEGTIRANLHSAIQRQHHYRGQEFFQRLGLDGSSQKMEIEIVRETMKNLKDYVFLKRWAWKPEFETSDELILANQLLQGDKGYSIPEMFAALRAADLEFISMVEWAEWDLTKMFKDLYELPVSVMMALAEMSVQEQLHICELLHSAHRLLDFWCGHPGETHPFVPVSEWTDSNWRQATVHLHPQLRTSEFKQELITHITQTDSGVVTIDAELKKEIGACVMQTRGLNINGYLPLAQQPVVLIDSAVADCILPLVEGGRSLPSLVERWQKLRPVNPVTLERYTEIESFEKVKQILNLLSEFGYILLECLS